MVFSDNLGKALTDWVYLFEIEVGHRIDGDTWSQSVTQNNCWYISHDEGEPSRVEEDGAALTERATLQLCHDNVGSWFYDSSTGELYLHVADSGDPGDGGQIILSFFWEYYTNKQDEDNPVIFTINSVNVYFEPRLNDMQIPSIDSEISNFQSGGNRRGFGSIYLINSDGFFDSRFTDYIYEAKSVVWKIGKLGDAYADYQVLWQGWSGEVKWMEDEIEIAIEDLRKYS